jgi:type I restriction enzyme S subunit
VVNNDPNNPEGLVPKDYKTYQIFEKDDLVFKLIDLENIRTSRVGLVHERGIMSPAYVRLTLSGIGDIRFYYQQFFDLYLRCIYNQIGEGVRSTIGWSDLANVRILAPPLPEQTAIVRFLDYMDRRIRRFIRAKQKLIKLLEEYRQALIHHAVTGKIDVRTGKPYLAYKDTSVPWLGKVPEHWEVRRLKRIARLNPSKSEVPLALRDGQAVFLPMERVGSDGRFDASEVRPISDLWNGFTYFRRGDVIVAKITPCFENGKGACLENLPTAIGFGSTEFHVIRPSSVVSAPYVYQVTTLSEFRRLGADEMTGAAGQQRVPAEFIANFLMPLPPLPEQTAIVEYLDTKTAKLDAAIAAARREIGLLREYRERLIADVVTGKVDVREVAAQLPEEPPEEEAGTEEEEAVAEELATVDSQEESNGEE